MKFRKTAVAIADFKTAWSAERPDLDPSAVATDLRMQLLARYFSSRSAEALLGYNLEWWEYDVLSALRRVGEPYECPVNSLSDVLPLTSGAITHRLNQLVARRLVSRRGDKEDRRRVLVRLSAKGLRLVNDAASARFDAAEEFIEVLDCGERKDLDKLLDKLLLGMEPRPVDSTFQT